MYAAEDRSVPDPSRGPRLAHQRHAITMWMFVTCAVIGAEFQLARITDVGLWVLVVPVGVLLTLWRITEPDPSP